MRTPLRKKSEPPVCEIIPDEKKENMRRFEAILKRLIAEVVEEQNEKLEKVLCEMIREEAANLFELYQSALEEAASRAGSAEKKLAPHIFREMLWKAVRL